MKRKLKRKTKPISKKTKTERHTDDPYLRQQETSLDMAAEGKSISKLRIAALKQAAQMPETDNGGPGQQIREYVFSQPAIPGQSNWVQMGPTAIPSGQSHSDSKVLVAGRITAVVLDSTDPDNIVYVGTAQGGIWKTTDSGRNWVAKSDYAASLSIGALVMDPTNRSILYAGTGEGNIAREIMGGHHPESYYGCGILKTTDGGEKWTVLGGDNNEFIGFSFFRLVINPLNSMIIFAATTRGLYKSTDGGGHWSRLCIDSENIVTTTAATDIVLNPLNPDIAYAAFKSRGIYKTVNANSDSPIWIRQEGDKDKRLPIDGFNRIALAISCTSPNVVYALMSDNSDVVSKFYNTNDDGRSWKRVPLPGMVYGRPYPDSIGPQGSYNINVAVDPSTPDIVYLSGVSLWKAIHNSLEDVWEIRDVGQNIHPDNHAFAFNPNDPFVIYTGNDGGIYKSNDGGETWIDVINEGLCITQFEFMDQHPHSDSVLFGGTQDNGTLQFRNNPAFYFSDYGDGGFVAIDPQNPNNIIHQYIRTTLYRSEHAGKRGTWVKIGDGIAGRPSLFYAPFTLDQENSKNIAFGSNKIFLDADQGRKKWRKPNGKENSIELNLENGELVSSINYVNSNLLYVGTTRGKVYRLTNMGNGWNPTPIQSDPLPKLYIWDIVSVPASDETVIVVMAGYGTQEKPDSHIWQGNIMDDMKTAVWRDIGGTGKSRLPDVPINSIVIDSRPPHTIYIGTDIGVFRTSNNSNETWIRFSHGLPNCAIYDMRLHISAPSRLLRIVTHGRGVWERDLDSKALPDVNLFVRDHLMDTGRFTPSIDSVRAAFDEELTQSNLRDGGKGVTLGTPLRWHMCSDIKVDALVENSYQMSTESVDYVKFEYQLFHRSLVPGRVNRVYVQVHNRGIKPAQKEVKIKLLYANLIANKDSVRFPELPRGFWEAFPDNSKEASDWKPVGTYKILPDPPKTLTNTEPTIVSWQWNVPPALADHIGILVIIDSPEDPIPEINKVFDIETLVRNEKHIGLKMVDSVNHNG